MPNAIPMAADIISFLDTDELPILFQRLGSHPAYLQTTWDKYQTVMQLPEIDRRTKELMGFVVAVAKTCDYMMAFQRQRAQAAGLDVDATLEALAVADFFIGFDAFAHALHIDSELRPRRLLAGDTSLIDQEFNVNVPYVRDTQDETVQKVYQDIQHTMNIPFVPNIFKALAHQPDALQAKWQGYKTIMRSGSLASLTKELLAVAVSAVNACFY